MSTYLGDYTLGQTVVFRWNTNAGDGASITRATNGTLRLYKDGDDAEITSGITDTEDSDSLTGVHKCSIDTSGLSARADYTVVLQGATIDGKTVNAEIKSFSIENRNVPGLVARGVAQATGSTTTNIVLAASSAFADDSLVGSIIHAKRGTGAGQTRYIRANALSGDTVTPDPALSTAFDDTTEYEIYAACPSPTTSMPDVNAAKVGGTAVTSQAATNFDVFFNNGGAASTATQAILTAIAGYLDTEIAAIKAKTDNLPSDPADASDIAAALAAISAFIDTEVAAIKAKTDNLPDDPADASVIAGLLAGVDAKIDSILDDTGTAGVVLSAAAVDAILDDVIEGSTTLRQMMRGFAAVLIGKASGLGTATAIYRDVGDTKPRVTATVDADGNRSAVVTDLT